MLNEITCFYRFVEFLFEISFFSLSLSLYDRKHRVDDKTVEEEMGLGKKSGFRRPVQVILQFYRLVLSGQLLRHKK